jgi:hypothetical protein
MKASEKHVVLIVLCLVAAPVCTPRGSEQPSTPVTRDGADAKRAAGSVQSGRGQSSARADGRIVDLKITLVRAVERALNEEHGGLLVEAELLPDEVPPAYLVKFLVAGKIKEVWIDGVDGRVQGSRTREVVPEHRDWVAEFPSIVGQFGKSGLQMLKDATDPPGGLTDVHEIKYERDMGKWSFRVLLPPEWMEENGNIFYCRGCFAYELGNNGGHSGQSVFCRTIGFDEKPTGAVPSGWSFKETRPTKALATWKLVADPTAPSKPNVLALTHPENIDGTFNLAILGLKYQNLTLAVKVKSVAGEEDQGGGPIWRCKDENNYYICRLNPLENNFRVYVVKDGMRKQLQSAKVESVAGRWYPVDVRMAGKHIECFLDGKKLLEVDDETFPDAGMIGLWTKADAVTSFDDLTLVDLNDVRPLATSQPVKP